MRASNAASLVSRSGAPGAEVDGGSGLDDGGGDGGDLAATSASVKQGQTGQEPSAESPG